MEDTTAQNRASTVPRFSGPVEESSAVLPEATQCSQAARPGAPVAAAALTTSTKPYHWKLVKFAPLAITAINGIGWLIAYFLVLAPQAEQNRTQTKLIDLQIDKLEAATIRLEDQLTNLKIRAQATTELNAARQSLRPNIIFGQFDFKFPQPDTVELEHDIKNIGVNASIVDVPNIRLSLKPIDSNSRREDLLISGKDFEVELYRPGMLEPGAVNRVSYTVHILGTKFRGSTLHYLFDWKISADAGAVSVARQILGAQISASELNELSTFTQLSTGTIAFTR